MSSTPATSQLRKPMTVPRLRDMKWSGEKITMLTAYDSTFAHHMDEAGVDLILVGDSLGMVIQGHSTTLPVTLDHVLYHSAAVARSIRTSLLIADLPFRSMLSVESAVEAASRLLAEGHAAMVKLEGATPLVLAMIRALVERSIPVCAHLGLTPQSIHALGGYRVQGKTSDAIRQISEAALAVHEAGASLLVLECIPEELAKHIGSICPLPTIGIGAGRFCDGQVLVIHDILGVTVGKLPKFVKNFLAGRDSIRGAIDAFVHEVRSLKFPAHEHIYHETL